MAFTIASFQLQSHSWVSWKSDQWCNASMPRAATCGSTAAKRSASGSTSGFRDTKTSPCQDSTR